MKPIDSISIHKAGSSVLNNYLGKLLAHKKYKIRQLARESFYSPYPEGQYCIDAMSSIESDTYYGCFRGTYSKNIPTLSDLRIAIQVRNPLDCLVSLYYSMTISHTLPTDPVKRKNFIKRGEEIASKGIDQFCIDSISGYIERFQVIDDIIKIHPDYKLMWYEDMVLKNKAWQKELIGFIESELDYNALKKEVAGMFKIPLKEDETKHKRKVLPGDHIEKLNPQTIETCKRVIEANSSDKSIIRHYQ